MKTVYLVRHGQSADNVSPVFQSPDSPLNEVGRQQAEKIASRISSISFDALIASPFPRAKETAEIIGEKTGKQPEFSDLFVERIKPTSIYGKPYTDQQANVTGREWAKSMHTPGMRVEDGENFEDILARADRALDLLTKRTEQSIVVVTHGHFLKTIVARILLGDTISGESFKNFHKTTEHKNTGLTVIRYHEGFEEPAKWNLWIYNDHAHLGEPE